MAHLLASDKLGERLFEARQAAGLSMRQLAQKAGVGEATISDIEKARQMPAADMVERLARALGIRPCWLAFGDGQQLIDIPTDDLPRSDCDSGTEQAD